MTILVELVRSFALAGAAAVIGMSLAEAWINRQRYVDPDDPWCGHQRLLYIIWVRIGIALTFLVVSGTIITKIGDPISWMAPSALVAVFVTGTGLWGILRDDEATLNDSYMHSRRKEDVPPSE